MASEIGCMEWLNPNAIKGLQVHQAGFNLRVDFCEARRELESFLMKTPSDS
jgi:hypothetical protein